MYDVKGFCDISCKLEISFFLFVLFIYLEMNLLFCWITSEIWVVTSFCRLIHYVIKCRGKIHVIDFTIVINVFKVNSVLCNSNTGTKLLQVP